MEKGRVRLTGRTGLLVIVTLLLAFSLTTIPVRAENYCDMARDIAAKAAQTFPKDKAKGVKLFIKAKNLCDKPLYSYNLGIAYYRYGNPAEAEKYLAQAVKGDGEQALWLNDYAVVILARNGDAGKALKLADKAFRLAGDDADLGPAIAETRAQAQLRSGEGLAALKGIQSAVNTWPQEKRLKSAALELEKDYVKAALALMQVGKRKAGLALLEKGAASSALAAQTLCRVLSRSGAGEQALAQAAVWKERYPGELATIWDEAVESESARLYERFRRGERAPAMQAAKLLHEKYAFEPKLKATYDKLFNAYINDDTSMVLAAARPQPVAGGGDIDVDRVLRDLYGAKPAVSGSQVSLEIAVDQDKNIRRGRMRRPHGIAVIIGNQRYAARKKGLPDVKYAGRDAAVMEKYLIKTMGFAKENILSSLDATGSDLRVMFGTRERPQKAKLYRYVKGERGQAEVFVYYVGHGAPSERGGEAYLVPVDAKIDYIETSGYPLSLFYRNLEVLPAKSVMVVLDACFSGDSAGGQLFKNISPAMLKNVSPIQELKKNSFVLCGAGQNQVCAWYPEKRHSLLTYYFFEALQGRADTNRDDKITAGELYKYVSDNVSRKALRMGRDQNPAHRGPDGLVLVEF